MSRNSPDNMQPPAGHPTPEHGKGSGKCPFAGLFTAIAQEEVPSSPNTALIASSLSEIGHYATFLDFFIQGDGNLQEENYGFSHFRQTRSYASTLVEKKTPAPGVESYMHVAHTQFRLMASRIGNMLDVDALTPESGHGITKDIAGMIAGYKKNSDRLQHEVIAIYAEADEAYKRKLAAGEILMDRNHRDKRVDLKWLKRCLGEARLQQFNATVDPIRQQMGEQFWDIEATLQRLPQVPIKTKQGTQWLNNKFLHYNTVAVSLWALSLSSESQVDPAKVGYDPMEGYSADIAKALLSTSGSTDGVISKSIIPLVHFLHEHAHRDIESLLEGTLKALRKNIAEHRDTLVGVIAAQDIKKGNDGAQDFFLDKITTQQPELSIENMAITPKEMVRLLQAAIKYSVFHAEVDKIVAVLATLPPNDTALLIKTFQAHPEWQDTLGDLGHEDSNIYHALLTSLFYPQEKERSQVRKL
ncbi:MAG: hypothetical protein SFT92_02020 [Rickettsiales bacterium]|nr:hypothetical protein [Rickettsiales bacterium]